MKYFFKVTIILFTISLLSAGLIAQQKGASPISSAVDPPPSTETYAVVVGISDYQDEGIPDLRFADKDAEAFARFLQSPAGGSLDEDHLKVLLNKQATVAQFAIALDWLWEVVEEGDRVIIYFSGHGDVERKSITQPGYLLCWDAPSKIYLAGGALALPMFQDVVSTLSTQNKAKVIVIADACRSGKLSGSSVGGAQITGSNLAQQYANEIKILSCQPDEYSIEGEQWGGGRGAFSYHLLDGLYGMADGNSDQKVNLLEIGRYLEDRVPMEVAPQSQIPMTVGSRGEKLTDVFPELLAQLRENKEKEMPFFAATASRGIEEDVLAAADTSIVEMYAAFKKALNDKQFLFADKGDSKNDYADFYFEKLIVEPQMNRLHSTMRRNYAAALQDDAQQVMNSWMKTSLEEAQKAEANKQKGRLPIKVFTEKISAFPACLNRAAELLGEEHYMYNTLQARKHFFMGYLLANSDRNPNKELGDKALVEFRQALEWQAELPQAFWQMSIVHGYNLQQPDSMELYAQKAIELYPSWIEPYASLGFIFSTKYRAFDLAKPYLEQAIKLDSNSLSVLNTWGVYNIRQNKFQDAENYLKRAIQLDSNYGHAISNLGLVYTYTQQYANAEKYILKSIELDSTHAISYNNLSMVYTDVKRFDEAERYALKSVELDSTLYASYHNLGRIYNLTNRLIDAEKNYKKAVQLKPDYSPSYINLGTIYSGFGRYEEAEEVFLKGVQSDSANWLGYVNLGELYKTLQRWEESATMMKKSIAHGPPIGGLVALLGNAYTHLPGRQEEAKTKLDKALEMDPNWSDTYVYLAQWSLKMEQQEQAWQYLEQGLEKHTGNRKLDFSKLQEEPDFKEMQKEAKWEELMKKYFPKEWGN